MSEQSDDNLEEWMRHAIHWLLHDADIPTDNHGAEDEDPEVLELVQGNYPLTETLPLSIVRIYKVGSRAEKTNIFAASDRDNIYEVGPSALFDNISDTGDHQYYHRKTDHEGFYQILDNKNDFLYPKLFQIKAGSQLHGQKDLFRKTGDISAAVTRDDEDQVLSMRLNGWPAEIDLVNKLEWYRHDIKGKFTGSKNTCITTTTKKTNIYLNGRGFGESTNPPNSA